MEDMEKDAGTMKAEGQEAGEVVMSQRMTKRAYWIDTQTYWYLMQLLELQTDEAEERFPWNIEILREVFEAAAAVLNKYGYGVCSPYVSKPETGRQYRCTLSECGCKSCSCQDEFMEQERLISNIEESAALNGYRVMGGGKDSIIVREASVGADFEIRVSQLAG